MKSGATLLTQSFIYDRALDKTNGALGVIKTGVQIPAGAMFLPLFNPMTVPGPKFVSSFLYVNQKFSGEPVQIGTTNNHTLLGGYTLTNPGWTGATNNPGASPFPLEMDSSLDILITIPNTPIAAGKFTFFIFYFPYQ